MTDWSSAKSSHALVPAVTVRFVSCWARSPAVTTVTWISDTGLLLVVAGRRRRSPERPIVCLSLDRICRAARRASRFAPPPILRCHASRCLGSTPPPYVGGSSSSVTERIGSAVPRAASRARRTVGEAGLDSCETRELFRLERLCEQV